MNASGLIVSRKCESEADFMALYLLKRAGYDIHEFGRTLSLLGEENVLSPTTQRLFALLEDHPCIPDRVRNIERSISVVERDFETKYRGENAGGVPEESSNGLDYVWAVPDMFAWSVCCNNHDDYVDEEQTIPHINTRRSVLNKHS